MRYVAPRLFLIDKPPLVSSFYALSSLKRQMQTSRIGHAGTLDPFSSGLLLAMSGKMTQLSYLFTQMDKQYDAVFQFGCETDTLDPEGKIIAHADIPEYQKIVDSIQLFTGEIEQIPPVYSAIKVNGRRSYEMARKGKNVQIPKRKVQIYSISIEHWASPYIHLKIRCSKGTYIRALARDMGYACSSRGYCFALRRTDIGPFNVESATRMSIIAEKVDEIGLTPIELAKFLAIPIIGASKEVSKSLRAGLNPMLIQSLPELYEGLNMISESNNRAVAILEKNGKNKKFRVLFHEEMDTVSSQQDYA